MKIYKSITETIGNTPLIEAREYAKAENLKARILLKVESCNPCGSAKDRVALQMIEDAEREGRLSEGGVIVEPTSGNTGIGISAIAVAKGYSAIIVMPDTMSIERQRLMKAYGATVVLTDGALGMDGAVKKADEIVATMPNAILAGQFFNPSNPKAHYLTTGPEIWKDSDGNVDYFVAGVGTGGTISGVGAYLKEMNADVRVIAVEPADSPLLRGGKAGAHKLQGIGANFIPQTLMQSIYDEVIDVTTDEAYETGRKVTRLEGILTGISGGAALYAGTVIARRKEAEGKTIVVLLPDSGERYLTTEGYLT